MDQEHVKGLYLTQNIYYQLHWLNKMSVHKNYSMSGGYGFIKFSNVALY